MPVRTRFAPSPTGFLHIGGARTALFCWLYARKHGGAFILRIEDTDLERSTAESVNAILEGMTWLGLEYDEGPFFQTQRFDRYKEILAQMVDEGKAYRCYCSKERLDALREDQTVRKEKPMYDRLCRAKAADSTEAPFVIRFKNPIEGDVLVDDLVRGKVVFNNSELDDLILARTDGTPTYNFTVVVDDMDMQISQVIRGDDHLNNTPRQINILKALGVTPPKYAHVPMILGEDGKRLSKRHGAVSVMQYREDGFLPEALLNYLVRLGWSHGDQEIFSLDEMRNLFDLNNLNNSASTFNASKLLWLNQHYIKTCDPAHVAHHLSWHMGRLGIDPSIGPNLVDVVRAQCERAKTLVEMAQNSVFFYKDFDHYDEKAAAKNLKPDILPALESLLTQFTALDVWQAPKIHLAIVTTAEKFGGNMGKIAQPLRVAITGGSVSPPIDITTELVGKERSLQRLSKAINYIVNQAPAPTQTP